MNGKLALAIAMRRYLAIVLASTLLLSCSTSNDLTDSEKSVLLTELDFREYGLKGEGQAAGRFTKTVDYINRSTELSYETPDDIEGIYISSSVVVERSAADALGTELANKAGVLIGFKAAGIQEVELAMSKPYGARSTVSIMKKDGKPIGNRVAVVVDKKVIMVIFSGIYFDTEARFREFFDGKIERVTTFQLPVKTS